MSTLHCALENGADLYVNERQKMRHYRARSAEERRKKRKNNAKSLFFYFGRCVRKLGYYSDSFDWKSAIEHDGMFKMSNSVPRARYSSICNVLHQWCILLIPTYRDYRLYDYKKMNKK